MRVGKAAGVWPLLAFLTDGRTARDAAQGHFPRISAAFARPFGFLALHRHSRLVLAAGWVMDPLPFPAYPWEHDE
ncbi:hypothetical protein ACWGKQ_36280 [Streptomyces sp. NPDC054770]